MRFAFTDDQTPLRRRPARPPVGEVHAGARARRLGRRAHGHDAALWSQLAGMGVLSACSCPSSSVGWAVSLSTLVLLFEQLGRHAVPGPGRRAHAGRASPRRRGHQPPRSRTAWLDGRRTCRTPDVAGVVLTGDGALAGFDAHAVDAIDGGRRLFTVDGAVEPCDSDRCARVRSPTSSRSAAAAVPRRARRPDDRDGGRVRPPAPPVRQADRIVPGGQAPARRRSAAGRVRQGAAVPGGVDPVDRRSDTLPATSAWRRRSPTTPPTARVAATMQVHGAIGYTWECRPAPLDEEGVGAAARLRRHPVPPPPRGRRGARS